MDAVHDESVQLSDYQEHRRLHLHSQAAGLYFHPNPLEPWFPSTAHSREDLDCVFLRIHDALEGL
jgi:glutamate-1-semialdehyde 2,1-aminomutase